MRDKYGSACYKEQNGKYFFEPEELPFFGKVSLANMTMFDVYCAYKKKENMLNDGIFVGIGGIGFFWFNSFVHFIYAKEKLNLGESDARAMADFINAQIVPEDHPTYGALHLTQGIIRKNYLNDEDEEL